MSEIKGILQKIERSLEGQELTEIIKLNSGFTRQEIAQKSESLPCILPQEIYELYQWHNGLSQEFNYLSSCEGSFWFLPLDSIIDFSRKICLRNSRSNLLLLPIFELLHEGGAEYFTILLGTDINPILHFYSLWN